MVDLGCGSGILPIILRENADYKGTLTLIDSLPNALKATDINLQLYGLFNNEFNLQEADIVDIWYPKFAPTRETPEKT